jgi:hypothetical protein
MRIPCIVMLAFAVAACTPPNGLRPDEPALASTPPGLDQSPDLSAYRTLEIASNTTSVREADRIQFVADGAYLEVRRSDADTPQRLYIQPDDCRNSVDSLCQRRFVVSGDVMAFASHLKCYIQIRNDTGIGYTGQALQGLCQDSYSRSFAITLSR